MYCMGNKAKLQAMGDHGNLTVWLYRIKSIRRNMITGHQKYKTFVSTNLQGEYIKRK